MSSATPMVRLPVSSSRPNAAPTRSSPTATTKAGCAMAGGRSVRLCSSLSAAMVQTRKGNHQATRSGISVPKDHSTLPMKREAAPHARENA